MIPEIESKGKLIKKNQIRGFGYLDKLYYAGIIFFFNVDFVVVVFCFFFAWYPFPSKKLATMARG